MKLRIATLQLNPILGKIEENTKRALFILEKSLQPPYPDLILLPELALTGYNFKSPQHIDPYLEIQGKGNSYELGKYISGKYNCHTVLGYPERKENLIYNSAYCISPSGSIIHNYRKSFLYETDETWGCSESPSGFTSFELNLKGKVFKTAIGICMDLNPYKFKAPFEKFEFANYCYENAVELVLVPTAWMNTSWKETWNKEDISYYQEIYSKEEPIEINVDEIAKNSIILDQDNVPDEFTRSYPDSQTSLYWAMRFQPFYSNRFTQPKLVAICNRSGMEDMLMYGGSSSIFRFNGRDLGSTADVNFFGTLGQGNEGILVRNVDI